MSASTGSTSGGNDNDAAEEVCNPAAAASAIHHHGSGGGGVGSGSCGGVNARRGSVTRTATFLTCTHLVTLLCGAFLATVSPLHESSKGTTTSEYAPENVHNASPSTPPPNPGRSHNAGGTEDTDTTFTPVAQNIPLSERHRVCVTQWTLIGAAAANYSQRFVEPASAGAHCFWFCPHAAQLGLETVQPVLPPCISYCTISTHVVSAAARPLGGRNPLTDELDSLFSWARSHGYEGLEMSVDDFRVRWFPRETYAQIIWEVQQRIERYGVPIVGSLLHVTDGDGRPGTGTARRMHSDGLPYDLDFADPNFWDEMQRRLRMQRQLGAEYVTYQISLPGHHQNTGGEYRHDDQYLRRVARDISRLQGLAFELGLNFYVETHVARVSEDPEAFVKIMDYAPTYFEVNVDISHYVYRNIVRGTFYDRIMQRAGHTHQRMARAFGDLSSDVLQHVRAHANETSDIDPKEDWEQGGLTYQAWVQMQAALRNGLSSRCIVGESGPWQLVYDAMATDAKLVPLYRLMATRADEWLITERDTTTIDVETKPPNPFS